MTIVTYTLVMLANPGYTLKNVRKLTLDNIYYARVSCQLVHCHMIHLRHMVVTVFCRGLATTWFRQDFVDQVQLVQEPNGRLERTVEPHIGCGVTTWIKIMATAGCSREAMLFIAPRRLPSITLRVIGVSLSKFSFWWAVAKTICVIPRGWPSSNGKNETPWHALRHVFAYEFIYYRATVIFENRSVVPSAFER